MFEHHGAFEELFDVHTHEFLGKRDVPDTFPARCYGYTGREYVTLTESVRVTTGTTERTLKASPERPRKVMTMLFPVCGRRAGETVV